MRRVISNPELKELREKVNSLVDSKKTILILLGAPGSGKGTQSAFLVEKYGLKHISTGQLLRDEVEKGSELGLKLKDILKSGKLVDDEIVIKLVEKFCNDNKDAAGFIFDGFPRSTKQAEMLTKILGDLGLSVSGTIYFDCSDDTVVERITNRRVHMKSGRIYHLTTLPPKTPGIDDVTGEPLEQRPDDCLESVKLRLEEYRKTTLPLVEYYEKNKCLYKFDGNGNLFDIRKDLTALFDIVNVFKSLEQPTD